MTCWSRSQTAARTSRTSSRASFSRTPDGQRRSPAQPGRRVEPRSGGPGVRLHERLPRRRQLDSDRGVDPVLKPYQAVLVAAFFNFAALFVFAPNVATTVGKGIVDQGIVDQYVV